MRFLFLICAIFCVNANAQTGYSILYERKKLSGNNDVSLFARLVFNDSASYFYHFHYGEKEDHHRKQKIFGKMPDNHSWYYTRTDSFLYEGHDYRDFNNPFLSYDTAQKNKWVLNDTKKMVAGYECNAGISISKNNDTTLVFYTTAILPAFAPGWFVGLPGTVLELYDQRSNWHLAAIEIMKGDFEIVRPKNAEIISREELVKKLKKKRGNN